MRPNLTPFAALGALALLAACQEQKQADAPVIRPVLSVVVAPQTERTLGFAGTVEARFRSDLGFRALGRIIGRDANVADLVKKGQRLATLDRATYRLAVQSAQAEVASALAQFENAAATETRQRTLLQQNITSEAQFEAARQSRESAEAGVTRARANLARAEEQLGYTELRADFDGVVTAVGAELGQVVQPGQTVVSVARPDIREAVIDLPEGIARDLGPGARFDVALQLDPSIRAAGSVREIAPQADPATRTVRVRISLSKPPESFRLGTTVTAAVTTQGAPGFELPATALLERGGRPTVWVVDPRTKTVSVQDVTVSAREGSLVRVTDGLAPGTRVVTAGVNSLSDGQAVKIMDESLR